VCLPDAEKLPDRAMFLHNKGSLLLPLLPSISASFPGAHPTEIYKHDAKDFKPEISFGQVL